MEFAVTPVSLPQGTVLAVTGELDLATVPAFSAAVEGALVARPAALVVDLTDTTFADSSACRALVLASRAAALAGCGLELVCPTANTSVRNVLDLVGIGAVTPLRERLVETAVGATGRHP